MLQRAFDVAAWARGSRIFIHVQVSRKYAHLYGSFRPMLSAVSHQYAVDTMAIRGMPVWCLAKTSRNLRIVSQS